MNVTAMIYGRIIGAGLTLASFESAPAIFSDRAPDAFIFAAEQAAPAVVIAAPLLDDESDTLTEGRRAVSQDVRLYQYDTGSSASLDALARSVRGLFHCREPELTLDAGHVAICTVSGPIEAPTTDAAVIGRRLTLHLTLEEN